MPDPERGAPGQNVPNRYARCAPKLHQEAGTGNKLEKSTDTEPRFKQVSRNRHGITSSCGFPHASQFAERLATRFP